MTEKKNKESATAANDEKIALLEKQIVDLREELKEAKGKRSADPDVVEGLTKRIAELEKKLTEQKSVELPGGGKVNLPTAAAPAAPSKPARAAAKKEADDETGNSLID